MIPLQIVDQLASHVSTITGTKNSYAIGDEPDSLTGRLPAMLFYFNDGTESQLVHHNNWITTLKVTGLLFCAERMKYGGSVKYIDNDSLVFPGRFRELFQKKSTRDDYEEYCFDFGYTSWEYISVDYQTTPYVGFAMNWFFKIYGDLVVDNIIPAVDTTRITRLSLLGLPRYE